MALLEALGLKPTNAMRAAAGAAAVAATAAAATPAPAAAAPAKGTGMQSPEMTALVARFRAVMARIKALESAGVSGAAALKQSAIAAGNLSTSAKGIVQANAALDRVEEGVAGASRTPASASSSQPLASSSQPAAAEEPGVCEEEPTASTAPPAAEADDQCLEPEAPADAAQPAFKGYPSTLQNAEKLIGQVKKYGFSEGKHATTMDAADRGDVQEIWCSGLSNWALAEAGYDLDKPVPGRTCFERKEKKDPKTGEVKVEIVERPVTLRSLVEGYPENVADTREEAEAGAGYAQAGLFGATPAEDDPRVKGAAGAFVLAGIGKEVLDLQDVKPGDFAQTRKVGSPVGHAFQIHACTCEGECLAGPAGAPTKVKDLGGEVIATAEGTWYAKASFRIDGATSPQYVGMHKVVSADWLESNIAAAMEDKSDKDGGVQIRHDTKFEDPTKGGKRTYVGRLGSSSWAGYTRADAPLKKPEAVSAP